MPYRRPAKLARVGISWPCSNVLKPSVLNRRHGQPNGKPTSDRLITGPLCLASGPDWLTSGPCYRLCCVAVVLPLTPPPIQPLSVNDTGACDCIRGGCMNTIRECALKVGSGRKVPCCTRESNLGSHALPPKLNYIHLFDCTSCLMALLQQN